MFFAIIYLATYLTKTCLRRLIFAKKKNADYIQEQKYINKELRDEIIFEIARCTTILANLTLNIWWLIVYHHMALSFEHLQSGYY